MSVKLKLVKYRETISSVPPLKEPVQKEAAQADCTASNLDVSGKNFSTSESFSKMFRTEPVQSN